MKKIDWNSEMKEIISFYKTIDDPLKLPYFRHMLPAKYHETQMTVQLLYDKSIENLLDLGTGYGSIPFYLMKKGLVKRMTGIDVNPKHKEKFYSNAQRLGLVDRVELIIHDLNTGIPSLSSKYDAITAFDTLLVEVRTEFTEDAECRMLNHESIIETMRNVTKSGARLLMISLCDKENCPAPAFFAKAIEERHMFASDFGNRKKLDYVLATIF